MIIIPTYNERENLENIIAAIHTVLDHVHVLVVDDNSPDGTGEIADRLASSDARIHVLHRAGKAGLGKAYLAGFEWALARPYERIFEMDADFSHDPKYLLPMLEASENADMVVGSRYVTGGGTRDWGALRKFISRGGGMYARTILGMKTQDLTAGFICFRRETLQKLALSEVTSNGYVFQIELKYRVHRMGMRIVEVPIVFPDRIAGESKMSPSIAAEAITKVWKLKMQVR